jgi:hypothetical protein
MSPAPVRIFPFLRFRKASTQVVVWVIGLALVGASAGALLGWFVPLDELLWGDSE